MTRRLPSLRGLLSLLLGSALLASCMPLGGTPFDSTQPEMMSFNSCGELEQYLRLQAFTKARRQQTAFSLGSVYNAQGFVQEPSLGTGGEVPAPPPIDVPYSETNLQEAGVDEADIFKVDATHAFALHGNKLVIIGALGDRVVDDGRGGIMRIDGGEVVAEVAVSGKPFQMFLEGNHVVVFTRTSAQEVKLLVGAAAVERPDTASVLKAMVYDVTDRAAPKLEREVAMDGEYVSSRRIGNHVYVIARAMLGGPKLDSPIGGDAAWLIQRELALRNAGLSAWLPNTYDVAYDAGIGQPTVSSVDCTRTYASRATGGDEAVGVYSFDLSDKTSPLQSTAVLGDGAVVYASKESIVVALTNYAAMQWGANDDGDTSAADDGWGVMLGDEPLIDTPDLGLGESTFDQVDDTPAEEKEATYLHRFAINDAGDVNYHATGKVEGWILNQFSISEFKGYVRVATTRTEMGTTRDSMVHVLQPRSKSGVLYAPRGTQAEFLDNVGRLDGIGADEDLYATRFQGDRGYLVTFRQTDPLWIIDLSNPTEPRLRGNLQVPGYSTYLHPVDNEKLLAIGRAGLSDGIKLSLFDVSDMDRPRAIDEEEEGSSVSESEALTEHRAFRYLPEDNLMLVPMDHGAESGLYAFRVDPRSGFSSLGRIGHEQLVDTASSAANVRRAYQIGAYLYAYSGAGVSISRLDTLETVASVDLPDVL